MIKPWHFGPLLAAVALAASGYWWHLQKDKWTPPAARKPDLPRLEPMPQPAAIQAQNALGRPVLWATRRPVETGEKKNGQADELMQSRLAAVLESGETRVALLQRKDGSPFKITAETKPWRIESFDGRKAVFVTEGGQRVVRPLEAGTPAPAKGVQAGGRARSPSVDQ